MHLVLLAALSHAALAQEDLGANDLGPGTSSEPFDPTVEQGDPIINGEDAATEDYPMTGATIMDAYLDMGQFGAGDVRMLVCSSTLIAPDVVMLAAHCVDEISFTYGMGSISDMEIRWTRQADLSDFDGSGRPSYPDDAVLAWDWVENSAFNLMQMQTGIAENADIALLFLSEAQTDLPIAYLPTEEEGAQVVSGMEVEIVGWGQQTATRTNESPPPGTYGYKQMGASVIGELGVGEFQVGPNEDDVRKCHGDSGGPTFAHVSTDSPETMRVIGVTSHSYDQTDCRSKGGVDTRVDAYLHWIDSEMRSRCADGSRAWCDEPGILALPEPEPEVTDPPDEDKRFPLSCSTGSTPATFGLAGLAMVALARRRR